MDHESCINKLGIHSQQNIRYKTVSGIYFTNFIEIMHSAYKIEFQYVNNDKWIILHSLRQI